MTTFSVKNLDARYTVSEELVLSFLPQWVARFEGSLIGVYDSRVLAECNCRWHYSMQMCAEEA
jgi:hypothetical protein